MLGASDGFADIEGGALEWVGWPLGSSDGLAEAVGTALGNTEGSLDGPLDVGG